MLAVNACENAVYAIGDDLRVSQQAKQTEKSAIARAHIECPIKVWRYGMTCRAWIVLYKRLVPKPCVVAPPPRWATAWLRLPENRYLPRSIVQYRLYYPERHEGLRQEKQRACGVRGVCVTNARSRADQVSGPIGQVHRQDHPQATAHSLKGVSKDRQVSPTPLFSMKSLDR
jgi:hypothetical protein